MIKYGSEGGEKRHAKHDSTNEIGSIEKDQINKEIKEVLKKWKTQDPIRNPPSSLPLFIVARLRFTFLVPCRRLRLLPRGPIVSSCNG